MIFEDYRKTNRVYHIVNINDFDNICKFGIKFDDKVSYKTKYLDFHNFIDKYKLDTIPDWVIRKKAIFGSMNFKDGHSWHSHSVVLSIKIDEELCWIANENLVNQVYEPFILRENKKFQFFNKYIEDVGINNIKRYWSTSLSFKNNLSKRVDKRDGEDWEVLIFHDIKPQDITPIGIITDHKFIKCDDIEKIYSK